MAQRPWPPSPWSWSGTRSSMRCAAGPILRHLTGTDGPDPFDLDVDESFHLWISALV